MTGLLIIAIAASAFYLYVYTPQLFKPARTANEQARKPHAQKSAETRSADPRHSSPQKVARVEFFDPESIDWRFPNA